jgi:hypothetical protein
MTRPTFESERDKALAMEQTLQDTLPDGVIVNTKDNNAAIPCGSGIGQGDGREFAGGREIEVTPDFDRTAWLEQLFAEYNAKPGWKVETRVRDGWDGIVKVTMESPDGLYSTADAQDGSPDESVPYIFLSSSTGVCSEPPLDLKPYGQR